MYSHKKLFIFLILTVLSLTLISLLLVKQIFNKTVRHATYFPPQAYKPDQIIIKYAPGKSPDEASEIVKQQEDTADTKIGILGKKKLFPSSHPPLSRYYLLFLPKGADVIRVENYYLQNDFIENTEPDFIVHASDIVPNDTYFPQQWGLSTIQMPKAWTITKGDTSIVVAVVDTGVDYNHPDLPKNIIKGPNYINGTQDPMDDSGHGTHVAGIIGALTNNGLGVSGINWNTTLMAIKALDGKGSGSETNIAQGIQYAADNGAKIINLSLGSDFPCSRTIVFQDIITYAVQKGSVVVAAAGNGRVVNGIETGIPENVTNVSPASCNGSIAVGATTQQDQRASFSNFGSRVDIAAPGVNILSTKSSVCAFCNANNTINNYVSLNGTSMATPHVAGVAGLIFSLNPALTPAEVKNCLLTGADKINTDLPIGPRLNAYNALNACLPSATPTLTPSVAHTPTQTPAPKNNPLGSQNIIIPSYTPQPSRAFDCSPDAACVKSKNTLQLCPMVCKLK